MQLLHATRMTCKTEPTADTAGLRYKMCHALGTDGVEAVA
jgi:hypothetical protein